MFAPLIVLIWILIFEAYHELKFHFLVQVTPIPLPHKRCSHFSPSKTAPIWAVLEGVC